LEFVEPWALVWQQLVCKHRSVTWLCLQRRQRERSKQQLAKAEPSGLYVQICGVAELEVALDGVCYSVSKRATRR
jgi:hypothetical protein